MENVAIRAARKAVKSRKETSQRLWLGGRTTAKCDATSDDRTMFSSREGQDKETIVLCYRRCPSLEAVLAKADLKRLSS